MSDMDNFTYGNEEHLKEIRTRTDNHLIGHELAVIFVTLMDVLEKVIRVMSLKSAENQSFDIEIQNKKYTINATNANDFYGETKQRVSLLLTDEYLKTYLHGLSKKQKDKRKETQENLVKFVRMLEDICNKDADGKEK